MEKDYNEYLAGGQITPEGREAGITDEDVVGGQFTPEAIARLEAEAAAPPKKGKKKAEAPAEPEQAPAEPEQAPAEDGG